MPTPLQHPALTPLQMQWQSIAAAQDVGGSAFVGGSLARREAQPMVGGADMGCEAHVKRGATSLAMCAIRGADERVFVGWVTCTTAFLSFTGGGPTVAGINPAVVAVFARALTTFYHNRPREYRTLSLCSVSPVAPFDRQRRKPYIHIRHTRARSDHRVDAEVTAKAEPE